MRVGIGYDVHRLVRGRKFILGGVDIPHKKGLLGHSDADVLLHAVTDAILGAASLGDIGMHFPDSNPKYKGTSSMLLLEEAVKLLDEKGFRVGNVDCTVILEEPRLSPYKEAIKNNISAALAISPERVNVKGKTEERLGFTGAKKGVKALAVALIEEK